MHWRQIRTRILNKFRRMPEETKRCHSERVADALRRIGATEAEQREIFSLFLQARERQLQRTEYKAKGSAHADERILELNKKAVELLGEKRAENFFAMCNDPYF